MVQQPVQGASATYAKEMERLSAKESLLLAFKDAGGFEGLVSGKTSDVQRIDVNERITSLERLNPTPRPTTSPFLEGRWNFEWLGIGTPGLFAVKIVFERFPSSLTNLSKMNVLIKDGNAKITAQLKFLNSVIIWDLHLARNCCTLIFFMSNRFGLNIFKDLYYQVLLFTIDTNPSGCQFKPIELV